MSAAAREAGRTFVTADAAAEAPGRAQSAAALVYQAHGFAPGEGSVAVTCQQDGCLDPGSSVVVDAQISVPLPLVPDFMRGTVPTAVTVTASHLEPVDEFRESGR